MNEHLKPEAAKLVAAIERGEEFLRNVVTGERLQPARKGHNNMTPEELDEYADIVRDMPAERVINQHQCFMTQREMLSAVAVHTRLMAVVLDQHLPTDLSRLDIGELEEVAYRVLQLVQGVRAAQIAEAQLAEAQRPKASGAPEFSGQVQMTCELTVGHPDGTTS